MNEAVRERKAALRRRIKTALRALSPTHRAMASAQACSRLQQEKVWIEAESILFYSPLADELDVGPLLRETLALGKTVALPRFDETQQVYLACRVQNLNSDLLTGRFGIAEPGDACPAIPLNRLDFLLVPGVGFSVNGYRLGRGKGFYDRLLKSAHGIKCGVGFDEQVIDDIPVEPHDVCLDCILTPTRWESASGARF